MITQKEARRLRGLICALLESADDNAHAGAQDPHTAMHIRGEFRLSKERVWSEIRKLTEVGPNEVEPK